MRLQYRAALVVLVTLLGTLIVATAAQDITVADAIVAAQDLYGAAAYEDAIAALNQLAASPVASDRELATIERYRALCLLALNRLDEAASAAEAMVRHDPLYAPALDDLSPRTREMFQQAQRHVLPGIAQEQYAEAKAAYEAGRPQEASSQFNRVLEMLDVIAAAGEAPPLMADLRVLAIGFRRLAAVASQASAPPENRPLPHGQAQTAGADRPASGQSAAAAPPEVTVTPPVAVRQDVPPWPRDLPVPQSAVAVVEVVIDQEGRVQQAQMAKALNPRYDQLLLSAARNWTYRPALRNGQPTPFVKAVRVELAPVR